MTLCTNSRGRLIDDVGALVLYSTGITSLDHMTVPAGDVSGRHSAVAILLDNTWRAPLVANDTLVRTPGQRIYPFRYTGRGSGFADCHYYQSKTQDHYDCYQPYDEQATRLQPAL